MISWMDKGIRTMEDYRRHEAEWEHRKTAETDREEAPAKRQYTQTEIKAAARYIKRSLVSRYEGRQCPGTYLFFRLSTRSDRCRCGIAA